MRIIVSALCLWMLGACGNDTSEEPAQSAPDAGADATAEPDREPVAEVACVDQQISQLMLLDEPALGGIRDEEGPGEGFYSLIDATNGGINMASSFVYARFSDDGLEKVAISDEASFESTDWDIAFRRYVVRLNSGVSGPGTVTAARTRPDTTFDGLESVPDGLEQRTEEYFTESCEYVADTSGIGAPATALSSFWTYAGCVQMTGFVYVVTLADGRQLKLEFESYYSPDIQLTCNDTGVAPTPSGAGNLRIRWAFLP